MRTDFFIYKNSSYRKAHHDQNPAPNSPDVKGQTMTSEVTLTKLINIRAPGVTVQTGPITKESTDLINKEDQN